MRAFFPWPGSKATFTFEVTGADSESDKEQAPSNKQLEDFDVRGKMVLKVIKTVVGKPKDWKGKRDTDITVTKDAMHVRCDDGSVLSILQVQKAGKKPVSIQAFANGELQNAFIHRNLPQQ